MTVQNTPVKELLDDAVPITPKWKLKKSVKKRLRELMEEDFLTGGCSFDKYTGQFIYTADRLDIQKSNLDGVEPGMKFAVPLKQVRFGKKVHRIL